MSAKTINLLNKQLLGDALAGSLKKLNPADEIRNPVMFVTWVGAAFTSAIFISDLIKGRFSGFELQITLWLWFTVIFANFAEAIAEGQGKAMAESLRRSRVEIMARLLKDNVEMEIAASLLKPGDIAICETGDIIPADGEVIEGIASIDESAVTGESAPVIRESGGDRSAVTGGTKVISDRIIVKITSTPGNSFIDRIIALIEGAKRQKTPNEIALTIVLAGMTIIFLLAVGTLKFFGDYSSQASNQDLSNIVTIPVLIALLVCLIPTTIGGLLSAIGIAGMGRLIRQNVIAKSGRAIEASGDIDILLLDKTGTITFGNRMAVEFIPAPMISTMHLAEAAQLASLADETPEGRSIVVLAKEKFQLRAQAIAPSKARFIQFTAQTRMSGVDVFDDDGKISLSIRKGAAEAIRMYVENNGGQFPVQLEQEITKISQSGGTPLAVADEKQYLGIIHLRDIVKGGIKERFAQLRNMGIKTVMITGDNPLTAAAIAAEAGVDDFIAQATPESKLERIRTEQAAGHLVAMTGDGTNDAPALAQADVAVAMNTGTQAAREAGNMVDLESNPTKLIQIVETGKQLLMTRGALTTFSIANDVAKYFAIIPAIFGTLYASAGSSFGPLSALNIMKLHSPQSAILSAIIFNALIIVALIPLALRGVKYTAQNASILLRTNLIIYGIGGLVAPFLGIKILDLVVTAIGLVG
jgi:potassium-transporting ATPase ATP-binding subunit